MELISREFVGKKVRTNYTKKERMYMIQDIDFEKNPLTQKVPFSKGVGVIEDISLVEYYWHQYRIKIKDEKQFLFKVRMPRRMKGKGVYSTMPTDETEVITTEGSEKISIKSDMNCEADEYIYLIPELCSIEGLPEYMKGNRDLLAPCRLEPDVRVKTAHDFLKKLAATKELKEWGLEIKEAPTAFKTRILKAPKMIDGCGPNEKDCTTNNLRRSEVLEGKVITDWIFVYERRNYDLAENVVFGMQSAARQIGIKINMPQFVEIPHEKDMRSLDEQLKDCVREFGIDIPVLVLLSQSYNYKPIKEVIYSHKLISQVMRV